MSTTVAPQEIQAAPERGATAFRLDVEGLRAVAVGLVLLFHVNFPGVPGGFAGVDVFFVISGFLITGLLVREVEARGTIDLKRFYARRAKRLFPASGLVLVATSVLTWLLVSRSEWENIGGDITAAAMYVVNWRLASNAVDYLAEGQGASPVQHFWSLAVEEQFYIVWPLLLLAVAALIRRGHVGVRPGMAVGLAMITIPSFAWSVYSTGATPASAYFVTTTRLWELGIGSLVAVGAPLWPRIARRYAASIGWAGLVVVVCGAMFQTTMTPWPGSAALVPTLGTAAVIVAGYNAGPKGPVRLLGLAPMVWIGGLSYSLYLWHWPLISIATLRWGELSLWQGIGLALASLLPAWLTHKLVENPLRYARIMSTQPWVAISTGANFTLVGLVAGLALSLTLAQSMTESAQPSGTALGAKALGKPTSTPQRPVHTSLVPTDQLVPNPLKAPSDLPSDYARNCPTTVYERIPKRCESGLPGQKIQIALIGDSKAIQWQPAFEKLAAERGWTLITYTKSQCTWSDSDQRLTGNEVYTQCRDWQREVTKLMMQEKPTVVVVSGGAGDGLDVQGRRSVQSLADGYLANWTAVTKAGVPVIALSDTQVPGASESYKCVADHPSDYDTKCTFERSAGRGTSPLKLAVDAAAAAKIRVAFADMDRWICPGERCDPVVGGVVLYRQGSHITATYAATMAPMLGVELDRAAARIKVSLR